MQFHQLVKNKEVIFWDFDGVIKDSVSVKTKAFSILFEKHGRGIQEKVVSYHLENGGVSRFDKVKYFYSHFLSETISKTKLNEICARFGEIVLQGVIDSPWVPGAEEYLRSNPYNQKFIIVTGAPQKEIEYIVEKLDLMDVFVSIHGTPGIKHEIVKKYIEQNSSENDDLLLIGDSRTDYEAAILNNISFVLRRTENNVFMHEMKGIHVINDFTNIKGISI